MIYRLTKSINHYQKIKKELIGLMKDEIGEKIMIEFVGLRPKSYFYLIDDGSNDKKAQKTKKMRDKKILTFNDYKNCLLNNEITLKSLQRFLSKAHNNKIALSSNDD